jgi:PAS domain S-box-containing protein
MAHLVLNVDAREHERADKTQILEQAGYRVVEAGTEAEALRLVKSERFTIVVVNNRLPQVDGYRLCRQLKATASPQGPFVLLLAPAFDGPTPPLEQIADAFLPAPPYYPALLAQVRLLARLAEVSAATVDHGGRERAREAVVLDLAADALAGRSGAAILDAVFLEADRQLAVDVGLAHRVDGTQELELETSRGVSALSLGAVERLELGQTFCGMAAATRTAVIADRTRIEEDPRGRVARELGLLLQVSFPLLGPDGQVLGAIGFGSTRRASLEPDEISLLERLSRVAGLALERDNLERARQEARATVDAFYGASPYLMAVIELAEAGPVVVHGNRAFAAVFGRTPEQLAGRSLAELGVGPDLVRVWVDRCVESRAGRRPVGFEYRHRRVDGPALWIAATVSSLGEENGRARFSLVADDATERIETERTLKANEEKLRVALAANRLGTWEWHVATDRTYGDARAIELYDLDPEATTTWRWLLEHRVHPDDRDRAMSALLAAAEGDGWFRADYRVIQRDGRIRWVTATGQMLFESSPDGRRPTRLIGTSEDITLVREAEDALLESENRFRQMIEALPLLAWTCEPDGRCDYLSPQWVAFTGIPAGPQLGSGWLEQVHPDDRDAVVKEWENSVANELPFAMEFRIQRFDKEYCWFETRALPLRDGAGRLVKWFGINTDVDARKRSDAALREADRRKDEFLAMLSHELRNPLAPIRNSVALLRQVGPIHPHLEQARDVIERQVLYLTRLIDDLLDVSRITQGKIRLQRGTLSLATVVERALETTRPLLDARQVGLSVTLPPRPLPIEGDLTRLVQAVSNLLHNAAKFTSEGGSIWLDLDAVGSEAVLRVRDNGVGIAPDLLPRIFDLFTQGHRSLDRSQGGLGVGLTIVKAIVELHGGRVSASSPGRDLGSEFTVRLPLVVPAGVSARPESAESDPSRRVLIVDDNSDAAESLALLFDLQGYSVRSTGDGTAAVRLAFEFRPSVIILDIGLPGMDGYEVARRLRAAPETAAALLVAVTGYGREQDRVLAREAGFDHHLVKPVDPEALQLLIAGHAATPGSI